MIITRTPYRISFLGGGSDIAGFYEKSYGKVLSATIQQYIYIFRYTLALIQMKHELSITVRK